MLKKAVAPGAAGHGIGHRHVSRTVLSSCCSYLIPGRSSRCACFVNQWRMPVKSHGSYSRQEFPSKDAGPFKKSLRVNQVTASRQDSAGSVDPRRPGKCVRVFHLPAIAPSGLLSMPPTTLRWPARSVQRIGPKGTPQCLGAPFRSIARDSSLNENLFRRRLWRQCPVLSVALFFRMRA